jgi:hypothetical protein
LEKLQIDYTFVSPTPDKALEYLHNNAVKPRSFNSITMPRNQDEWKIGVSELIENLDKSFLKVNIFFSWLPIFSETEFTNILNKVKSKNLSFYGVSQLNKNSVIEYSKDYSFEFQDIFNSSESCSVLWVWHEPNESSDSKSKVRRLPEYYAPSKHAINRNQTNLELNFYGRLSAFRGISEILIIALFNPKLNINIKGLGYSIFGLWRPSRNYSGIRRNPVRGLFAIVLSLMISLLRFLPNVRYSTQPFSNESDLEIAILSSKFIFMGCKLPHSSGIALTAMANKIPVIWFGKFGEGVKVLKKGSPFGEIEILDIFIPGKVTRMIKRIHDKKPTPVFSQQEFLTELSKLKS